MSWWLRAHRVETVAGMVAVFGVATWLGVSGRFLDGSVASPVRPGSAVPMALWLPIAVAAVVCWALSVDEGPSVGSRSVAVRSNGRLVAGYVSAVVGAAVVALVPAALSDGREMAGVARNVVGLVGVALILRQRLGGPAASATTAAYMAMCALLGSNNDGTAAWWAFPVADRMGPIDLVAAAALFVAGIAVVSRPTIRKARPMSDDEVNR